MARRRSFARAAREIAAQTPRPWDLDVDELGVAFQRPVYDFVSLALAEDRDGVLVTADLRLERPLAGTRWASRVLTLAGLGGAQAG